MIGKRKDENHNEIAATFRSFGAEVIDTTGDPTLGMDMLVVLHGRIEIVEVKDGEKPESKRRLTPTEQKRKEQVERKGVAYNVIEDIDGAIQLAKAMR